MLVTETLIIVLLSMIFCVKLWVIQRYHTANIDQYNHDAYIKSLSTNFIIKSSAINEVNCYPFLVHLLMRHKILKSLRIYFAILFDTLFLLLFFLFLRNVLDMVLQECLFYTLIISLSTAIFGQIQFFSARLFGMFFYNLVLLVTSSGLDIYTQVLLEIPCFCLILLSSKFAHQAFLLMVLPIVIYFGKIDLLISYPFALLLLFIISRERIFNILRGHLLHCVWSFKYQFEYYIVGGYFKDLGEEKGKAREVDLFRTARKLFLLLKEPLLFFIPFAVFFADLSMSFLMLIVLSGLGIYVFLAFYTRLDRSIGEAGRYLEYALLPLVLMLAQGEIHTSPNAWFLLLVVSVLSLLLMVIITRRNFQHLEQNRRIFPNVHSDRILNYINTLPLSRIVSLPLSISTYLAQVTKHKFFCPYTYMGGYFLSRRGISPFFELSDDNLIKQKYVKYVIIDTTFVPGKVLQMIVEDCKLKCIFEEEVYQVYKKEL